MPAMTLSRLAAGYVARSTLAAMLLVSDGAVSRAPLAADEGPVDRLTIAPEIEPERVVGAQHANRGLIVFDNALLDRLFGKDRARESNPAPQESGNPVSSDENARSQETLIALLAPDEVFTARLHSSMPAQQRALLRFAEQGRKYLQAGDPAMALRLFEKALSIGSTQYLPYIYYYLAQSHFRLGNYQAAREFRDVAETWLGEFPDWQLEIARLEQTRFSAREMS